MIRTIVATIILTGVLFIGTATAACESCSSSCALTLPALVSESTVAQPYSNVSCQYNFGPRGSWYSLVGNGKVVQVDTCDERNNFDTVLMAFRSCRQTRGVYDDCLAMDDDGCGARHSKLTFFAEAGRTYFIFVTGYQGSTGVYYLAAAESTPPTAGQCKNAINIIRFPYVSESDTATTVPVKDTCLDTESAGMWYHLVGNGEPFLAHTCNLNTNFDTVIEVYGNCSREDRTGGGPCITYNDDSCYKQSMVSWRSVMNSEYWVFVTGHQNERGTYTLEIEKTGLNPNSHCDEPIDIITFPFVHTGTTAKLQESWSECTQKNHNGVWFRMHGLNRKVIISTCTEDNYKGDSVIDVYTACSSTTHQASQCVASNDDYCGMNAAIIIDTHQPIYYIYVYGFTAGVTGINYTLSVLPYEEANNTQCWYASHIERLPMDFSGNTRGVQHCHAGCDGSGAERRGAWFKYVHFGPPTVVTATTCNRANIIQARLEVYNDCHVMSCTAQAGYDTKKNCTTVSFAVENGKTYNTLLTADDLGNPGGFYHVDFFEQRSSNHSQCDQAVVVPEDGLPFRTEAYTGLAKPSWSSCSGVNKQGYWVRVVGTGNKIVATTCDTQTDFDTILELYSQCQPEGSTAGCIDYEDDDDTCGLSSRLEWDSDKGAVYWLFVTGHSGASGIFVLNVYHMESPPNSQCLQSKGITALPYYAYGLTTFAAVSNASCEYGLRKGLWYSLYGDDHWITVETCGSETNYETEIEVYMDCNEQGGKVCLNHNHDTKCPPQTAIEFPAIRYVLYWIYVTGAHTDVMAEGFFKLSVLPGRPIEPPVTSSEKRKGGLTGMQVVAIIFGVFWGVGLVAGISAGIFGWYKKRHIDYVHIGGSDTAPAVPDAPASEVH